VRIPWRGTSLPGRLVRPADDEVARPTLITIGGGSGGLAAAQRAAEYGARVAVIESARHVAELPGAHSTEFNSQTPHPVIALITEWIADDGRVEARDMESHKGGTMRLGAQECLLEPGSLARRLYGRPVIREEMTSENTRPAAPLSLSILK